MQIWNNNHFDATPYKLEPLVYSTVGLVSQIPDGDITTYGMRGEMRGMMIKFGPPSLWFELNNPSKTNRGPTSFHSTDNEAHASDDFHHICIALITKILKWGSCSRLSAESHTSGLFGKVIGFVGRVTGTTPTGLHIGLMIWLANSTTPPSLSEHWSEIPERDSTLLYLFDSEHSITTFRKRETLDMNDRVLIQKICNGKVPLRIFTNIMSLLKETRATGVGVSASLIQDCATSVLFNGNVSSLEMMRAITGLGCGYTSHTFTELHWDGLVKTVKTSLVLHGNNRYPFLL
jgi:hypothetical protein